MKLKSVKKGGINPVTVEKIVSAACYLSGGLIGIVYIILSRSKGQSMFFRFHFIQAMMLAVIAFLIKFTAEITMQISGGVLGLLNNPALQAQILSVVSIVVQFVLGGIFPVLCLYGLIWALLGKYAEIPVISPLVRQNLGR